MAGESRSSDPEVLKEAFKQAAEIAAVVPQPMQDAAFHRALDQILGVQEPSPHEKGGRAPLSRGGPRDSTAAADHAQQLIDGVNRTAHPEVAAATKVLDQALAVLRIAARDFNIDGLTAPEIAKVLTDKFRQRTSRQAVSQALGAAHTMVDTGKRGRSAVYRIMQAGEAYLEAGGAQSASDETGQTTPTRRTRRKSSPRRRRKASSSETPTRASPTRSSRRRGPKTVLSELIDEGFFGQPKTINDAQEQLKHKKGLSFTLQDLSPSLVRLLREGRLDRDRNASGHYEYRSK
jgi:hypothetical protein